MFNPLNPEPHKPLDPLNLNISNTTSFQQNLIVVSGIVAWTVVGMFFLRIILSYCLPYVTVEEGEAMVVERSSRFNRIITNGTHLITPFYENLRKVNWSYYDRNNGFVPIETHRIMTRKTKLLLTPVKLQTKDSQRVTVTFNAVFIIGDLKHVVYQVPNLYTSVEKLLQLRLRECIASMLIENMTLLQLQENISAFLESDTSRKAIEKRGLSQVQCKIVDIKLPAILTEKKERLEEIEIQQEVDERLYKQQSLMRKREMNDILSFCRENNLDNSVLSSMLTGVVRSTSSSSSSSGLESS